MNLTLNAEDISNLSPAARAELRALFFPKDEIDLPDGFTEDDFENVVDLTVEQVEEIMLGCSQATKDGLEVIAIHGPVFDAHLLHEVEIQNLGHWQGSVTKRTRTVTRDKDAFLLSWDDWPSYDDGIGRYAVTQKTHESLRAYFDSI